MRRDQRRVYYFDLSAYSRTRTPQVPDLEELFVVWHSRWQAQQSKYLRDKGNRSFSIKDISFTDDYITMLISVIDKNMPDAAYGNTQTGETMIFEKETDQGNTLTGHLVITRHAQIANKYVCLLEGVPRITATNVSGLLSRMLHDAYNDDKKTFTYPDPGASRDGARVRRIGYLPYVRLLGHISPRLVADIEGGRIKHIELTKSYEMRPFNEDPYIREETSVLRLVVSKNMPSEGRWQHMKDQLLLGRGEYVAANISFVAPDGRSKDVEYDMENDSFENESYIKSEQICDIEPHLADASLSIVEHFAERMRQIIIKEGGGSP